MAQGMVRTFFTFGADHKTAKVPDPLNQFVCVEAPAGWDARAVFMLWLGSNRFSHEYNEQQFNDYFFQYSPTPAANITVTVDEVWA
jgi:hypothetical protein